MLTYYLSQYKKRWQNVLIRFVLIISAIGVWIGIQIRQASIESRTLQEMNIEVSGSEMPRLLVPFEILFDILGENTGGHIGSRFLTIADFFRKTERATALILEENAVVDFSKLSDVAPYVELISVATTSIDDSTLLELPMLKNLWFIHVQNSTSVPQLTMKSTLETLANCKKLDSLRLKDFIINKKSMADLGLLNLPNLELVNCKFDEGDLPLLLHPNLNGLELNDCDVSEKTIIKLQSMQPTSEIWIQYK
ncbi:MAG: hypothetical protein CMN21_00720 [Rubinisphaera sp.]|nr:hypothetical protein [Rubinisphaera sp.]